MANHRPLVIINGVKNRLSTSDRVEAGAGVVSSGSVPLALDGNAQGVHIVDALLTLEKEINHTIHVLPSTNGNTAGGDLTVAAGQAAGTGGGGNLKLRGGNGTPHGAVYIGETYTTSVLIGPTTGSNTIIVGQSTGTETIKVGYTATTSPSTTSTTIYLGTGSAGYSQNVIYIGNYGSTSASSVNIYGDQVKIPANSTGQIGFFSTTPASQQSSAALTNNVSSGGTNDTIADFTVTVSNGTATTSALTTDVNSRLSSIRNDIYQLARKVGQINSALRLYGLLA
jgi:hypothetical protein